MEGRGMLANNDKTLLVSPWSRMCTTCCGFSIFFKSKNPFLQLGLYRDERPHCERNAHTTVHEKRRNYVLLMIVPRVHHLA